MRKKTITHIIDCSFWALIAILPLIAYIVILWHSGSAGVDIATVFSRAGFDIVTDNVIFNGLSQLFGVNGVMPFYANDNLLIYLSYFIFVEITHVAVDVLLFIPRFAHKLMNNNKVGDML